MSLTEFVKSEQIKQKFRNEFKPIYKKNIKPFRKSRKGDIIQKETFGIYFEILNDKVKIICDSNGRIKWISSIEDLIGFFSQSKFGKNLCWFYTPNFNPILKYLPKSNLDDLAQFGKTEFYAHMIECEDNKILKVSLRKSHHEVKFYNLYPFFNLSLEDAGKKCLNHQISIPINLKKMNKSIGYWDNNRDVIVKACVEKAKLIQALAKERLEHDAHNDLSKITIINEPKTENYTTVGTAFDYLLRFLIKAYNPAAITRRWVAYYSLNKLKGKEKKKAVSILQDAENRYSRFLKEKEIKDDLISSTLLLAKLDVVVRRGVTLDEIDMDIDPEDVVDLKNLIKGVPKDMFLNKKICFLNPTFGLAWHLVEGGDADLMLDNTLIEIKTTKDSKFSPLYWDQLMGYVLLHYLGLLYSNNIKEIDKFGLLQQGNEEKLDYEFLNTKIEKIGVYFSRFNYLYTLNLSEILPKGKMDWNLLEWFENETHEEYQPVHIKKIFKKTAWKKMKYGKISVDELLYPNS